MIIDSNTTYPIIDVFAGPGGLGEGFSSCRGSGGNQRFNIKLSVECDEHAHKTLLLRHFLRQFPAGQLPDDYYEMLRGEMSVEDLYALYPDECRSAGDSAQRITLGPDSRTLIHRMIRQRLNGRDRWALIGGPPCQAYSLVGRSRMRKMTGFEQDHRHFLYKEYLQLIADHQPPVFVMENVKGLLSSKIGGELIVNQILIDLSDPGKTLKIADAVLGYRLYSLSHPDTPIDAGNPGMLIVKSEDYGIPQARHRIFIVGIRRDISIKPRALVRSPSPTVRQTLDGLPALRSGLSGEDDTSGLWLSALRKLSNLDLSSIPIPDEQRRKVRRVIDHAVSDRRSPLERKSSLYSSADDFGFAALQFMKDSRLDVLTEHESRSHMATDLERYLFAAAFCRIMKRSPKLPDFPAALLPNHKNIRSDSGETVFSDRFRVQLPDMPSTTITSHISKDGHYYIHYDPFQARSLTVREAARLQTFPDNYLFLGPRTEQYHQVGNAVPPYLALQIAEIIAEVLDSIPVKNCG